eukprot:CAMPEP_0198124328 /NCGR_PEP_ID=MMETSP1442-20131203/39699_1 /TAXON_ID= /ORGANISM="Craspedostauros australis, Strain CCMP3328" /LENGTH=139 /DNA_ID=CAMNT_0043783711 /DNA_START=670 /DNA_END=1088 /DNA_ORIENTATION=-
MAIETRNGDSDSSMDNRNVLEDRRRMALAEEEEGEDRHAREALRRMTAGEGVLGVHDVTLRFGFALQRRGAEFAHGVEVGSEAPHEDLEAVRDGEADAVRRQQHADGCLEVVLDGGHGGSDGGSGVPVVAVAREVDGGA